MVSKAWLLLLGVAVGCQDLAGTPPPPRVPTTAARGVTLAGAGSTFVQPLVESWSSAFSHAHPGVALRYRGLGSGTGIKLIADAQVDFGATDVPMTDEELRAAPGIVHLPIAAGAVVLVYNLKGVSGLKLTPETLAGIYRGTITSWNDPQLAKINGGAQLPALPVVVVHRREPSGTSSIFTDYLSKASPAWKTSVGAGKSVNWPTGFSAVGSEGVAEFVVRTEGAVGYVEQNYATKLRLPLARLRNRAGVFVEPSPDGVSAAIAQAAIPDDFRASITDAPGPAAWPISGLSWALVRAEQADRQKGEAVLEFLWWAIRDGGQQATDLHYAPLPPELVSRIEASLNTIKVQGKDFVPSTHASR